MLDFDVLSSTTANASTWSVIYAMILAFVLSMAISLTYAMTYQGLSYSRNFLHSIILSALLTAVTMQAIGDNLARGLGMFGAISLLRFRTNIKDPKDMLFLYAALAAGLGCGVHAYSIAVIGTLGFIAVAIFLRKAPFISGPEFDGVLRMNIESATNARTLVDSIVSDHCRHFALLSVKDLGQGSRLDLTYQVKLREQLRGESFVEKLKTVEGAKGVTLLMQDLSQEV